MIISHYTIKTHIRFSKYDNIVLFPFHDGGGLCCCSIDSLDFLVFRRNEASLDEILHKQHEIDLKFITFGNVWCTLMFMG